MKMLTKQSLSLLTLSAVFAANAETLTVESDLAVEGALSVGSSLVEITDPSNPQTIDLSSLANESIAPETRLGQLGVWGFPRLYDPMTSNYFASADKKFSVSFSGAISNTIAGNLFNGRLIAENYANYVDSGQTGTIIIDLTKGGTLSGITSWVRGKLFISSYYREKFEVTDVRITNSSDTSSSLGSSYIKSSITEGPDSDTVWEIEIPNLEPFWQMKEIQIDVLGTNGSDTTTIAEIEYYRDFIPLGDTGSMVTKYRPETLYDTLNFKNAAGNETIALNPETGLISAKSITLEGSATITDDNQLTTKAYVDNQVVQLASDAIVDKTYLGHSNFSPLPRLDDPITRNYFASADKRFEVSYTGVLVGADMGKMFDGTNNGYSYNRINPGETVTLTIDLTAKGNGMLVYPNGRIYISTYHTRGVQVVGARMQYRSNPFDPNNPSIVKDLMNNVKSLRESGIYKDTLWQISMDNTNFAQILEIDLHNPGTELMSIAEIEYLLDRPLSLFRSVITKYGPETFHHTLNFKNAAGDETIALDPETGLISAKSITLEGSATITDSNQLTTKAYVDTAVSGVQAQNLSITGDQLSISGGNTVTLPTGSSSSSELLHPVTGESVLVVDSNGSSTVSGDLTVEGNLVLSSHPGDIPTITYE